MFVVAAALLGLIALLGSLQYTWLGRISEAERDRRTATLNAHATGFAQDFDRELTRAFLLFQLEASQDASAASRVAARYDRWTATARYPRMVRDFYVVRSSDGGAPVLQRFNPSTRFLEPAEWPASMAALREQLTAPPDRLPGAGNTFVRFGMRSLWEEVPALLVPMDLMVFTQHTDGASLKLPARSAPPALSYAVLVLDREYIAREIMPALAEQHFNQAGDGADYQFAVVSSASDDVVYRSAAHFSPAADAKVDAATDLFQVRTQENSAMVSEIRRFSTVIAKPGSAGQWVGGTPGSPNAEPGTATSRFMIRESAPMSIVVQQSLRPQERAALERSVMTGTVTALTTRATAQQARWRLLVQHRAGSLEAAVNTTRRRNLFVSSSILAVLGASVGLLILSTRRAQDLARQQMEFVAAVSHELRTPLAVIRSAGDNLADGVVRDDAQIRKYGDLVRNEGRRLTEMVEQILEFAGIQSGQRGFALRPVPVRPLLEEVVAASGALVDAARLQVEFDMPATLPPVLGDESALRRVFQNLLGNAIKYGASGGWIGLRATASGREVRITIADRGIGIAPAEQAQIFQPFYRTPDVIAMQIQGAGLGLSLVTRIVEAHGGRISVRSEPGQGSAFTVHLPAASEESVTRRAETQAAANPSPNHS
jgi:signal transduction histidine kinase